MTEKWKTWNARVETTDGGWRANCVNLATARKVAHEHNSHDALVLLLRGMYELADDGSASFDDPPDDSIYLKVKAALAAAEVKP